MIYIIFLYHVNNQKKIGSHTEQKNKKQDTTKSLILAQDER